MLPPELAIPATTLAAIVVMMLSELRRSRVNERRLRERGAIEPDGDVYRIMALVYPGVFVLMASEGVAVGRSPDAVLVAGFVLLLAAKLLKLWAIATLGTRWSYRVLVLPGAALISTGPYAYLRHPNYVAVFGEIAGFALMVDARLSGPVSLVLFALLVRKRVQVEEKALRYT